MFVRKYWLVLLAIVMIAVLSACGASRSELEPPISDLNVQVIETQEIEPNLEELLFIHFIDVGEGDAILIVQGNYSMLIDGGPPEMGTTVVDYLRNHGISRLDYIVATHPFADHVGGLRNVLRQINTQNILLPMVYHDTPAYNAFLVAAEDSGADVAVPFAGHTFSLGNAAVTILSPSPTDEWDNRANYSIVMRVEFGLTSFLLMGDAMREVEANLLNSTALLSSDVLKVARHGAQSATTSAFLDAVSPSIAVISAGTDNSFLSQEVLRRLNDAGTHIFRTDLNGSIVITSDGTLLRAGVERVGR